MADDTRTAPARHDFLLSRKLDDDSYGVWRLDVEGDDLLQPMPLDPRASFDRTHSLIAIGGYLLEWGPLTLQSYRPCFPYRLFAFDPASKSPLAAKAVQQGIWNKTKFWRSRIDFGNPEGAKKDFESSSDLMLLPLGSSFVLNFMPTAGRGTFQVWNFDPSPIAPGSGADPLPQTYMPQGSFDSIENGHELIPFGNYVLDRVTESGDYRVWSFDPQSPTPLTYPPIQRGCWKHLDGKRRLVAIGDLVLDWDPADRRYRLWRFDPKCADPLTGPVREGVLPEAFDAKTTLTGVQPLLPIDQARKEVPGTIDFMRAKIKHVVYLMLENRSFDHVCGWLYQKGETGINFIGHNGPFQGANLEMFNIDPLAKDKEQQKVFLSKYQDGKPNPDTMLDFLAYDPYHDKSDVLRQYFYKNREGYAQRAKPDMDGFVWNNGARAVMMTYTPEQIPVLNGLARNFAVSDEWFGSMPGATDSNRAFALTGSTLGQLNNFQNDNLYIYWPFTPHRPSIWKVLWSNGITDWKIYNSVEWQQFVLTYHLFLQSQIPTVDAKKSDFIAGIDQFKKDAASGKLPAFSFLEPVWIAPVGTTSYHPGADLVPGERALNDIYNAIKSGPAWNETLFVISFDEHGGLFDHVPPPYAESPWPNDASDGFRYDLMGVRVPTIIVSPWIEPQTVFRSPTPVAYDSTSFLATLLQWFGIPRSRWGLGDRTHHAPSFEAVCTRVEPRRDRPSFTPPCDKAFPSDGMAGEDVGLHDLHRLMAPRAVWALAAEKMSAHECCRIADDILERATDLKTLHALIDDVAKKVR